MYLFFVVLLAYGWTCFSFVFFVLLVDGGQPVVGDGKGYSGCAGGSSAVRGGCRQNDRCDCGIALWPPGIKLLWFYYSYTPGVVKMVYCTSTTATINDNNSN